MLFSLMNNIRCWQKAHGSHGRPPPPLVSPSSPLLSGMSCEGTMGDRQPSATGPSDVLWVMPSPLSPWSPSTQGRSLADKSWAVPALHRTLLVGSLCSPSLYLSLALPGLADLHFLVLLPSPTHFADVRSASGSACSLCFLLLRLPLGLSWVSPQKIACMSTSSLVSDLWSTQKVRESWSD